MGVAVASRSNSSPWSTLVWIGFPLSVALMGATMSHASYAPAGDPTMFAMYWVAMGLMLLPVAGALLSKRTRRLERHGVITLLGVFACVPKVLAYPYRPAYFDEVAHWTQVERLFSDGLPFMKNNQVVVIGDYPAMHMVATAIRHATGLSTYATSLVIVSIMHVVTIVAVARVGALLSGSDHTGGVAALFYGIGPGYWYFTTQFAYESFAIALFAWCVVMAIALVRSAVLSRERTGFVIALTVMGCATVTSHHLSSYVNLGVLWAFALVSCAAVLWRHERLVNAADLVFVAATVSLFTGFWLVTQAPNTKHYLEPYIDRGFSDLGAFVSKSDNATASKAEKPRELFSGSTLPIYEQIAGFIAPLVSAVLLGFGILGLWRRRKNGALAWGLALIATGYVVVYPLMFSVSGASMARRSWSFTNVGVAAVIAIGLAKTLRSQKTWWRRLNVAAISVSSVVLMVGNVAIGINEAYRFPGPYIYGSDTRSVTEEIRSASMWFRNAQGEDQPMVTDRGALVAFASLGRGIPAITDTGFQAWNLILSDQLPDRKLLTAIRDRSTPRFVVLDEHQTRERPSIGYYVDQSEPRAQTYEVPLSMASITKFDDAPYAIRVYASETLEIIRLAPDDFGLGSS